MNRARSYRAVVLILQLVGLGLLPAIAWAHGPKSEGTYITTAPVNVKSGPGDGYETVRKFRKATTFEIVGREGTWLKIQLAEHKDHFGYVDERLAAVKDRRVLDISPRSAIPAAYVTSAPISVRQGPGEDYPIISTRPKGTRILVIGMDGDWLRIATRRGHPQEYVARRSTFVEHAD